MSISMGSVGCYVTIAEIIGMNTKKVNPILFITFCKATIRSFVRVSFQRDYHVSYFFNTFPHTKGEKVLNNSILRVLQGKGA